MDHTSVVKVMELRTTELAFPQNNGRRRRKRMEAISKIGKTKGAGEGGGEVRRLHIIYFLSRMGRIEHPHLIRVHHLNRNGVYLRDIKRWLGDLRGKDIAESFAWSYKRRYKNGYVWQDLLDDDLITPISDNEYVLKGSEILPPSTPLAASPYFEKKPSSLNINIGNNDHDDAEEVGDEEKDHHQYHHKQPALAGHPPPPKSDNSSASPPPSTKTTSPSETYHHQQSPVFGSELSTLTDDSIKQDQRHPISKLRTFCQDQQEEEELEKVEQQQMSKSASSSSSFYSSLPLGKKKTTTARKEKQDKVNNEEFSGSGGSEEYSSDAILFTNNGTAIAATGDDVHKYCKKKMHNHSSSSSFSWSSSTSTSVPSQSPFAKSKSYSSATSKMLRNFIKCGAVDTNDSALVAAINSNIHENKSTATTTSAAATMSLNNNNNNGKMESSSSKQKICKREIVGGSTRVFGTPWNQQPQQQSSTTATAAAATTTRKSLEGVKCSKSKQQQSGRKVVSAAYKPVGAPICSQCGKSFKPEKLHTHMKSCRGLKAIAKAATSSSFSASSSSVSVERKYSSHKSEGEGSSREESTHAYFLSN